MRFMEDAFSRICGRGQFLGMEARAAALLAATAFAAAGLQAAPKQADTTPPSVAFVNHPPSHIGTPTVTFSWDPPTDDVGVTYLHLLLGSSANSQTTYGNIDVLGLTSYEYTATSSGQRVYPRLVARDAANNETVVVGSNIRFDFEGPEITGLGGPTSGFDNQTVRVAWMFTDTNSGPGEQFLDIGTDVGLDDLGTLDVKFREETTFDAGDFLAPGSIHGASLYFRLRASDAVGNETVVQTTTPTVLDIVPPSAVGITAGASGTLISFNYTATDDLSGLVSSRLTVGTTPSNGNYYFNNVSVPGSRTFDGFDGLRLYGQINVKDKAGNETPSSVVTAKVDFSPPTVMFEIVGKPRTIADEVTIITKFNEELADPLDPEDISLIGMPGTFTVTSITESEFDVTLIPNDPDADGTMAFEIASTGVEDFFGHVFEGATSPTVTFDHTALIVGSASADCGEQIEIPVEVMNADGIDALGFSIDYNSACLTYLGATAGSDISSGWAFQSQVNGSGRFTIGAFRTTASAPISGDAEIAVLKFRFLRQTESCESHLVPVNVVDDIATYTIVDGFVECGNGPGALPGDVNDDGNVTPADAREAFLCYINGICAPGAVDERAEIAPDDGDNCASLHDGDDVIDPDDAQRVFEIFLNVGGAGPCN